jgi:hypothetical protein
MHSRISLTHFFWSFLCHILTILIRFLNPFTLPHHSNSINRRNSRKHPKVAMYPSAEAVLSPRDMLTLSLGKRHNPETHTKGFSCVLSDQVSHHTTTESYLKPGTAPRFFFGEPGACRTFYVITDHNPDSISYSLCLEKRRLPRASLQVTLLTNLIFRLLMIWTSRKTSDLSISLFL